MQQNLIYKTQYSYFRGIYLPFLIITYILISWVIECRCFLPIKDNLWFLISLLIFFFGFQQFFISTISLDTDCLRLLYPYPICIIKKPKVITLNSIEKLVIVRYTLGYTVEKFRIILKDGRTKNYAYGFIKIKSKTEMISQMEKTGLKIEYFDSAFKPKRNKY
jgi:hypothetical protein